MAFGLRSGRKALRRTLSGLKQVALKSTTIPNGYFAVHVGEDELKKRYAVPVSYLNKPVHSRIAVYGRGRVWIQASNGWTHNSLQRRHLH